MLDWNRFESLPGAVTENFEKLCRAIVNQKFRILGPLKELKNQPGVEFYIELNRDDFRLGYSGQIVGWQCKWFQYRANGQLTTNAKTQIEQSLERTKEYLPGLSHWFLWTQKKLSKPDQTWFYSLKDIYGFDLHLWDEKDLDEFLSGAALEIRNSYFGELALTNQMLAEQHVISVAPVKHRWMHDVHQKLDIEIKVRQILGEPSAWENFEKSSNSLTQLIEDIGSYIDQSDYQPWRCELIEFMGKCETYTSYCELFNSPINGKHLAQINDFVEYSITNSNNSIRQVLIALRQKNLPLSLVITNSLAYIKDIKVLLKDAHDLLSHQLIAMIADAGGGKTQLAAELTFQNSIRPAGILFLGRDLKKGATLDDLARRISFYNLPVPSFVALIAALDAAGTRTDCRLPIVIDGLNEAQDPREWKSLLDSIQPTLRKYTNVVLICTLRTSEYSRSSQWRRQQSEGRVNSRESFAHQALPDDCLKLYSNGFSKTVTRSAINTYFKHYKIEADPSKAPKDFFSHPLNLKIFCEVTNRAAKKVVRVAHFPSSIYNLFSEKIRHSAQTIAGMTSLSIRYKESDIDKAIYVIGQILWFDGSRSTSEEKFRIASRMELAEWDSDIINLLSQEGLIFRDESEHYKYELTPVYERLGGYFISNYLLRRYRAQDLTDWMQAEEFIKKLFGEISDQHELSQDILHALVAMAPKGNKGHVWQAIPSEYSSRVLALSTLIDANDLDSETRDAFKKDILKDKLPENTIEQLNTLRNAVGHPFNADFLSDVLMELQIADRDLSWTEYNRAQCQELIDGIKRRIDCWRSGGWGDEEVERLRALSLCWILTSSCSELRDAATEALFHYGLQFPVNFLGICKRLMTVNDPFVSERILAACYGVIGTLLPKGTAIEVIGHFAKAIHNAIFSQDAIAATTHVLSREYARSIIIIVRKYIPGLFTDDQLLHADPPFSSMPRKEWGKIDVNENITRVESPFRMDFENYTIGRLVSGRSNYDYKHPNYQEIKNKILWRIVDLGWNFKKFALVEQKIETYNDYTIGHRPKIERYGKKYSWIAYYEMAGKLLDEAKLEIKGERFAVDIDPFFPRNSSPKVNDVSFFLGDTSITTKQWVVNDELTNLEDFLTITEFNDQSDNWVLLNGKLEEESKRLNRSYYCHVRTFLVKASEKDKLSAFLNNLDQIDWPAMFETSFIYSGELYENREFSFEEFSDIQIKVGYEEQIIERQKIVFNGKIFVEQGKEIINVPIYENVSVQIPVIGYLWEHSDTRISWISREFLAPWVVDSLALTFEVDNLTYFDSQGVLAVKYINQEGATYVNHHDLLYLRKDLLILLLEKNGLELVSKIRGEKRYAQPDHSHSLEDDSPRYKEFEFVNFFSK